MRIRLLFGTFFALLAFSSLSSAQGFHRTEIASPELSRNDQFPIVSPTGQFLIVKSMDFTDLLLKRKPDGNYGLEANLNRFGSSSDILWSVNDSGTYAYSSLRDEEAYCSVSTVTKDGNEHELFKTTYGDFDGCDLSRVAISNNGSLIFTLRRWINGNGTTDFLEETVAMFCSAGGSCSALTEPVPSDNFYFDALFTPDNRIVLYRSDVPEIGNSPSEMTSVRVPAIRSKKRKYFSIGLSADGSPMIFLIQRNKVLFGKLGAARARSVSLAKAPPIFNSEGNLEVGLAVSLAYQGDINCLEPSSSDIAVLRVIGGTSSRKLLAFGAVKESPTGKLFSLEVDRETTRPSNHCLPALDMGGTSLMLKGDCTKEHEGQSGSGLRDAELFLSLSTVWLPTRYFSESCFVELTIGSEDFARIGKFTLKAGNTSIEVDRPGIRLVETTFEGVCGHDAIQFPYRHPEWQSIGTQILCHRE